MEWPKVTNVVSVLIAFMILYQGTGRIYKHAPGSRMGKTTFFPFPYLNKSSLLPNDRNIGKGVAEQVKRSKVFG